MNILLMTYGSQGDVQPFVALGRALVRAGHEVRLAAPARFEKFSTDHGVPFAPLSDALVDAMDTPEIRAARESGRAGSGPRAVLRSLDQAKAALRATLEDSWAIASEGADVVVHHPITAGQHVAEKLGVPTVVAAIEPVAVPTQAFPNPYAPAPSWLPPLFNRLTYRFAGLASLPFQQVVDDWRASIGLGRRPGRNDPRRLPGGGYAPVLHGFSRYVVPPPRDWPDNAHVTGYWFLPAGEGWTPPADLVRFLDAGEPPVFVGFGSMVGGEPGRVGRIVLEAVRAAGVRAVLSGGWGGIEAGEETDSETGGAPGDEVFVLTGHVPFTWLFPRMAAVASHCGAGTTATALAAGRPQVTVPADVSQPMWADRFHRIGVSPEPIPYARLTVADLTRAIRAATTDPSYARRAAELAELVAGEDGTGTAVQLIERYAVRSG